jgi:thiol-disulfide isomerase/thioredoxin
VHDNPEGGMKHLDKIANIAIIVAVIVFLGLVVRGDIGFHRAAQPPMQDLVGKSVSLPGVQLPRDRSSLLIVVSTTCHFCKDSLPFYKQLSEKSRGRLNLVAVLPQPQPEARKFLQDAGVEADQIVSASPDAVGARGTPTVLLVDGSGKVTRAWVGRLDEKGQQGLLEFALPTKAS